MRVLFVSIILEIIKIWVKGSLRCKIEVIQFLFCNLALFLDVLI